MKRSKLWLIVGMILIAVAAVNGVYVNAQGSAQQQDKSQQQKERDVLIEREQGIIKRKSDEPAAPAGAIFDAMKMRGSADTLVFISSEVGFSGKPVKGAPYSAQSVMEDVQTLADGNRIVRKNTSNVYRDSEGRTRHDHTLSAVGPFAVAGDPPQTISINDPVAGVNYVLDPRSRTARKMPMPRLEEMAKDAAKDGAKRVMILNNVQTAERVKGNSEDVLIGAPAARAERFEMALPPPSSLEVFEPKAGTDKNVKQESLGKQTIEGVEAEGTRLTVTIPAGQIGNEQPIIIVSERWYSPELQTVVMTKHSDPRFGEHTFRLTDINRTEQPRSLFEVPADYTIKEVSPEIQRIRSGKPKKE